MSTTLAVFLLGAAFFVAGDVAWLRRRAQQRPLDLALTLGLLGAGVALMGFAALVLL